MGKIFYLLVIIGALNPLLAWGECPAYLLKSYESSLTLESDLSGYFKDRTVFINSLAFLEKQNKDISLYHDETQGMVYHENRARTLAKKIAHRSSMAKTIVYPAAGYDSATPFLVFPTAERIVALDDHPFWSEDSVVDSDEHLSRKIISSHRLSTGWAIYKELNQLKSLAAKILFHLSHAYSEFRLLDMYEVKDLTKGSDVKDLVLSHGVIVFDTGEGTPVRSYVHLQTPFLHREIGEISTWWFENVKAQGFKGLFFKAAMNAQRTYTGFNLGLHVRNHGGVIVDADYRMVTADTAQTKELLKSARAYKIKHRQFGYAPIVSLIVYKQ